MANSDPHYQDTPNFNQPPITPMTPSLLSSLQTSADKQFGFKAPPQADQSTNNSRVSAANLSRLAKINGRCGDINPLTGYVCVTQPHMSDTKHMAVQIGGPNDGKVYSEWD